MIFETVTTTGNEVILNFNYITMVEEVVICNPSGHPCCGEKGDTCLRISVAHSSAWVKIACDHDGNDLTEQFLKAYKEWGYQAK
tara:strand:- start:521 stop:772 length:252 start_codon:yes stop_codon:yes gene_type:complete